MLETKIEIMSMSKSTKRKISVWVVMALLVGGMVFLVVRDKKISTANDAGYYVSDTTVYVPESSE